MTSAPRPVKVCFLGRQRYRPVFAAMQSYTQQRTEASADELWVVEHDPVFTQGQAGKPEHLLAPGDIEVVQTDRGGQVTYHGPGQVVIYLLLDLRRLGLGVKALVRGIEQVMVRTLAVHGVVAAPRDGAPGVYVGRHKIGALGLRVKRGCSYHGLSLNVAMDLEPFSRINPCGLVDTGVIDLAAMRALKGTPQSLIEAMPLAPGALAAQAGRTMSPDARASMMCELQDQLVVELATEYGLVPSPGEPSLAAG